MHHSVQFSEIIVSEKDFILFMICVAMAPIGIAFPIIAVYLMGRYDLRQGIPAITKSYPTLPLSGEAKEFRCSIVTIGFSPYFYSICIHVDRNYLFLSPVQSESSKDVFQFLRFISRPFGADLQKTIAIPLEQVSCRDYGLLKRFLIKDKQRSLNFSFLADVSRRDCKIIREGSQKR